MSTFASAEELKSAIHVLERRKELQERGLSRRLFLAYEPVQPSHRWRDSLKDVVTAPRERFAIACGAVGYAIGYLSHGLFGLLSNPMRIFPRQRETHRVAGYVLGRGGTAPPPLLGPDLRVHGRSGPGPEGTLNMLR